MSKLQLFYSFLLLPFLSICSIQSFAENSTMSYINQIQKIDLEITSLKKDLETNRKENFNYELQAQPFMFDHWHEFAEDINSAEENEKTVLSLKKKIKALNEQKEKLLKENQHLRLAI